MKSESEDKQDISKNHGTKSNKVEEAKLIDSQLVIQMEDEMIDWDYANKVKNEFLEIYPKIVNEIRPIYFTRILEIMNKANITFEVNTIIEIARKSFLESLQEQFDKVWEAQRLAFNLTQVNILKRAWIHDKNPKWRPTGKTVAEQTLPIRCKMLEAKKNYILKQWERQKLQLQSLVVEIEKNRGHINELARRREELLFKMDINSEKFEDMKKRFREKQLKICRTLRQ